ncbi:hypothetical protein WICPIJ_000740 [Wickerhamomyces pijperi]|uniref:Uncharacterized protein n=1 Tax=Wickerhamomyces pijperi TaxID=599730 RepID=A0A9P8QG21_WICPI|nr:hypothetical protein WICPIJ_000740 [Wickerhamomyces pijperi]
MVEFVDSNPSRPIPNTGANVESPYSMNKTVPLVSPVDESLAEYTPNCSQSIVADASPMSADKELYKSSPTLVGSESGSVSESLSRLKRDPRRRRVPMEGLITLAYFFSSMVRYPSKPELELPPALSLVEQNELSLP